MEELKKTVHNRIILCFERLKDLDLFSTEFLGSYHFKNVEHPMDIYALSCSGLRVPDRSTITGKLKQASQTNKENAIVVLPFENELQNSDQDFIVEGIGDEIRSQLTSINGLKVISRSSSMSYKGKNYSLRNLAQELQVDYVLEGRVQVIDDQFKLHIELSNAQTDRQLWSMPEQRNSLQELYSIQNDVALSVAAHLLLPLNAEPLNRTFCAD